MLTVRDTRSRPAVETGAVTVIFALLLTLFMLFGSVVISVGSWYTHARQLQTKVDAAALAGGGVWSFPCNPDADTRIASTARVFFGEHMAADGSAIPGAYNQQVGGVEGDQVYVSLNQADWWDDSFPNFDFTQPAGSVCSAKSLDVKATEDDSPLLWGWLPFFPDIKKRAKVELEEAHGLTDLLPIAVRVPKPVSSAAIFFDEADGSILAVRYFADEPSLPGIPAGLEGMSTRSRPTASIPGLPRKTGVAIALSFVPACVSTDTPSPCFEDEGFTTVDALCNQGTAAQVATCYSGSGTWPSRNVTTGLHFMRGYSGNNVGNGPPELRGAFLENSSCESNGYFNSIFVGGCEAKLTVDVDLGSVIVGGGDDDDDDDDDGDDGTQTRRAENVELRYALVRADGSTFCNNYGTGCLLRPVDPDDTGVATYTTIGDSASQNVPLTAASGANAIAIQVRVKNSPVSPNPGNCGVNLNNFHQNCRWFHVGSGIVSTSSAPGSAQILASPVQRAFMGDLDLSGPVKWLRVNKDLNCDRDTTDFGEATDGEAATHSSAIGSCFWVDMGLKGGMARDQDEPPFSFVEGSGPSQMGFLDCDPAYNQGHQGLVDAVVGGCKPFYVGNKFNSNPLCPDQNQFFDLPKPAPFDDWPPLDCVKTRSTGSGNQILDGLNLRIFGTTNNPSCPGDNGSDYVRGRNYWHRDNNLYDGMTFAWNHDTPSTFDDQTNRINPADPRLVTLFFTPYDSFAGSGNEVFPVVALGSFYITGYGRLNGNGGFQGGGPEDPCSDGNDSTEPGAGNNPPPDLDTVGGNSSGAAVWGHFVKGVVQSGATQGGNGPCNEASLNPCVAVLVE
jgi:hypothetical protein